MSEVSVSKETKELTDFVINEIHKRNTLIEKSIEFKNKLCDMVDVGSVKVYSFEQGWVDLKLDITEYSKDKMIRLVKGLKENLEKDDQITHGCLTDSMMGNKIIMIVSDKEKVFSNMYDKFYGKG